VNILTAGKLKLSRLRASLYSNTL